MGYAQQFHLGRPPPLPPEARESCIAIQLPSFSACPSPHELTLLLYEPHLTTPHSLSQGSTPQRVVESPGDHELPEISNQGLYSKLMSPSLDLRITYPLVADAFEADPTAHMSQVFMADVRRGLHNMVALQFRGTTHMVDMPWDPGVAEGSCVVKTTVKVGLPEGH